MYPCLVVKIEKQNEIYRILLINITIYRVLYPKYVNKLSLLNIAVLYTSSH